MSVKLRAILRYLYFLCIFGYSLDVHTSFSAHFFLLLISHEKCLHTILPSAGWLFAYLAKPPPLHCFTVCKYPAIDINSLLACVARKITMISGHFNHSCNFYTICTFPKKPVCGCIFSPLIRLDPNHSIWLYIMQWLYSYYYYFVCDVVWLFLVGANWYKL